MTGLPPSLVSRPERSDTSRVCSESTAWPTRVVRIARGGAEVEGELPGQPFGGLLRRAGRIVPPADQGDQCVPQPGQHLPFGGVDRRLVAGGAGLGLAFDGR